MKYIIIDYLLYPKDSTILKKSILLISHLFINIFQKICLSKKFFVILHSQILYK